MKIATPTQSKLLLGSGNWNWGDWFKIDASPESKADCIASIPPLPPVVHERQWTSIMAIHFIEHIAPWKAEDLIRECYDILAPEGTIILEQPNILYAAQVLLGIIPRPEEEFSGQYDMAPLYGDASHRDELMLHRWGYTPETMTDLLIRCGFDGDRVAVYKTEFHGGRDRDFRIEAVK